MVRKIRTYEDIPLSSVAGGAVGVFVILGAATRFNPAGFLGALLAVVFAFFFVTVASRIVGIVGTTSMPLSGMTIGALLMTCLILQSLRASPARPGWSLRSWSVPWSLSPSRWAATSRRSQNRLPRGRDAEVGADHPDDRVLISASFVGLIVQLLSPQVVSGQLEAPQANLMFLITEGVMRGNLPWVPVCLGMGIAACVELMGIGSLPFAVGLYLPLKLTATLFIGGVLHALVMNLLPGRARKEATDRGLLVSSGLVAGDALVGVALALMAAANFNLPARLGTASLGFNENQWVTVAIFAALCLYLCRQVYMHRPRVALAADVRRSRRFNLMRGAVWLLLCWLLAAPCLAQTPSPKPSPTPSTTPSPTPLQTPSPTPSPTPLSSIAPATNAPVYLDGLVLLKVGPSGELTAEERPAAPRSPGIGAHAQSGRAGGTHRGG